MCRSMLRQFRAVLVWLKVWSAMIAIMEDARLDVPPTTSLAWVAAAMAVHASGEIRLFRLACIAFSLPFARLVRVFF